MCFMKTAAFASLVGLVAFNLHGCGGCANAESAALEACMTSKINADATDMGAMCTSMKEVMMCFDGCCDIEYEVVKDFVIVI